jgi:putative ABC transport system permease protein
MAQPSKTLPRHANPTASASGVVPPTVTLALWRFRHVWWLLLLTCIGMLAAVTLACTVPLYSNVMMSAGVRSILTATPQNADISVLSTSQKVSASTLASVTQDLNHEFARYLGPYLTPSQFSFSTPAWNISAIAPGPNGESVFHPHGDKYEMTLTSSEIDRAPTHLTLLRGRLPHNSSTDNNDIEIALTELNAQELHVDVGTVLTTTMNFINGDLQEATRTLTLHVVGIYTLPVNDTFWHGQDFAPYQPSDFVTIFNGLADNQALVTTLSEICSNPQLQGYVFQTPASVNWYYHLDVSHITIKDLASIVNGINTIKIDNANATSLEQSPYVDQSQTYLPSPALQEYNARIAVAQLPVTSLLWLMIALLLFFITFMADLLVERQVDTIAVLRSRGASRGQVFGSLVTQGLALVIVALLLGPLLALPTTRLLAQQTLAPADQGALNILDSNMWTQLLNIRSYALLAAGAALLALIVAVLRSLGMDVLTARREAARTTHRPLWQRWNLDIGAAILALVGAAAAAYVTNAGILDAQSALVLISPLTLLGAVCLLIAGMLLLLRFFPVLLSYAARLTRSTRGAAPLLALAQMARAPRQSLRMTLMLAIAIAFALFTLLCIASQQQRVIDQTNYLVGADFTGTIPVNIVTTQQLADVTKAYESVQGVQAASLGYVKPAIAGNNIQGAPIDFKAVDGDTFAQTAIWTPENSPQPLSALMHQLVAQRTTAIATQHIPAIVDSRAWNTLHLHQGAIFTLNFQLSDYANLMNFVAVAEVNTIPTPGAGDNPGVLVDYRTFAAVYKNKYAPGSNFAVPANTVWLRTVSNPAQLQQLYSVLAKGDLRLDFLYDRRAMAASLYHEPLYLTLTGILALGAGLALLLAIVGNLLASWLSVRSRLTSFTVLRALGATPAQVALALIWEQSIIYIAAVLLGIVFGAIFSELVIPVLVFTSILPSGSTFAISNGAFYLAQTQPPIEIVVPPTLVLALGTLLVLCLATLGMMVRLASRPSIGQTLRLNED